jgi:site-specific recombinase XerD
LEPVERVTLTDQEMAAFFSLTLESPGLERVRKQFCLMLLTGLNYADLERLTPAHIKTSEKGDKYVDLKRRKTSKAALPPLNGMALSLLASLWPEDALPNEPLLTIQRNQPFNRSIKQICHMANIEKNVTSKVARNSLATYLVNNGASLPVVAAILGHSSTLTSQRYYLKTNPQTVIDAVKNLPIPGDKPQTAKP